MGTFAFPSWRVRICDQDHDIALDALFLFKVCENAGVPKYRVSGSISSKTKRSRGWLVGEERSERGEHQHRGHQAGHAQQ
jgi:hypothetical protein